MDFNEWYDAVRTEDEARANALFRDGFKVLVGYLITTMNAEEHDAEEIAQETMITVYEKIRSDEISSRKAVYSYTIRTARNSFISLVRNRQDDLDIDDTQHHIADAPSQIANLVKQELQDLLDWCVKQLDAKAKRFFNYWMTQPDASAQKAASRFKTTENNVWVRKHRLINDLRECVESNSK